MTTLAERIPPQDPDAERSVIGSVLRNNLLLADVLPIVKADDFRSYAHQRLFEGLVSLIQSGAGADPVTLADWLKAKKLATDIGGYHYLVELWDAAPSTGNVVHYARIVKRFAVLRGLIHAIGELQAEAYAPDADPDELITRAEEAIFRLGAGQSESRLVDWKTVLADCQTRIDRRSQRAESGEVDEGLKTGWPLFDQWTGGLYKGELTIVAARPSVGKTMVAVHLINTICGNGHSVFLASIEQGRLDIGDRMLAQLSRVNSRAFRVGMTEDDAVRVADAAAASSDYRFWIDDSPKQTVAGIASHARRLKMRHGLDMIVVDYLGLINSTRHRGMSRAEEVGTLVHGLNELKKELGVAVMLLAQLNRGVDGQPSGKPRLSNLRESGDIEQDADTVLLLHKPQDPDEHRPTDDLDVIIAKQRNGPCGTISMLHEKATFRVYEAVPE